NLFPAPALKSPHAHTPSTCKLDFVQIQVLQICLTHPVSHVFLLLLFDCSLVGPERGHRTNSPTSSGAVPMPDDSPAPLSRPSLGAAISRRSGSPQRLLDRASVALAAIPRAFRTGIRPRPRPTVV